MSTSELLDRITNDPRYAIMREYRSICADTRHVYNCSIGTPFEARALTAVCLAESALDHFMIHSEDCLADLADPNCGYTGPMADFIARMVQEWSMSHD